MMYVGWILVATEPGQILYNHYSFPFGNFSYTNR